MVTLLFYCSQMPHLNLQNLTRIITQVVSDQDIEIHITLTSFLKRLKTYSSVSDLAVLVAVTQEELDGFYAFRKILQHMDIILIVPDNDKATLSKGRQLFPRFITSIENEFHPIELVLHKMIKRSHIRNLGTRYENE